MVGLRYAKTRWVVIGDPLGMRQHAGWQGAGRRIKEEEEEPKAEEKSVTTGNQTFCCIDKDVYLKKIFFFDILLLFSARKVNTIV